LRGHFAAAGVPVKRKVIEFRVSQVQHAVLLLSKTHVAFIVTGSVMR
jgi:hypothetical protein